MNCLNGDDDGKYCLMRQYRTEDLLSRLLCEEALT